MKLLLSTAVFAVVAVAQVPSAPNPAQKPETVNGDTPLFSVTVVQRTTQAVNYRYRGGDTDVDFRGTALAPRAKGDAEIESERGYVKVDLDVKDLPLAYTFGPEYLTYVLWAISPEGRATNLGEVRINSGGDAKLNVTTELQTFGMIVTAEPYFGVTQPSDVVVMENVVRQDTEGRREVINAKYDLLKRGTYTFNGVAPVSRELPRNPQKEVLDVFQARNALQIARAAGADRYAPEPFNKAQELVRQAEDYRARGENKPASTVSRDAVQRAEDARIITLQRREEERLAQERQAAADREAAARAQAEAEARQRELAEKQRQLEQQQRIAAEQARQQAEAAKTQAEQERLAAERAKAEAEAARLAAEQAQQEALKQQQLLAQQAAQAQQAADQAERARLSAEEDRLRLREQLRQQFNMILETRESARGLIVNMSDVLFDFGKYTLKPGAREKLAKISGIILAHPGLNIEVEGHTDSVGSDEFNQKLSEQRAMAVRDYLVTQGIQPTSVTARGFGEARPVASNDNAAGRQQNRRVELVVSGGIIGTDDAQQSQTAPVPSTVPAAPVPPGQVQ
jgi:outer membrane protein OmpA-like peptidoglycan-associated protein